MIEGSHNSTQAFASTQVYDHDENGNSNFDSVENDVFFVIMRVLSPWKPEAFLVNVTQHPLCFFQLEI